MHRKRVAILISGRGSNMMALVESARTDAVVSDASVRAATRASSTPEFPAEIVGVISNRADAAGLAWAAARGLSTLAIEHKRFATRDAFDAELQRALENWRVDIVCLAGFMRILTGPFVERWQGRMLNIHPSLLPSFKGLDTHEQALAAGVKLAGCTVHFVVPEMDAGPIVAQAVVTVEDDDTADTLAARILVEEHRIYPLALRLLAEGRLRIESGRVRVERGEPIQ